MPPARRWSDNARRTVMHGGTNMASKVKTEASGRAFRGGSWVGAPSAPRPAPVAMRSPPNELDAFRLHCCAAPMFGIVGGLFELTVRASGKLAYRAGAAAGTWRRLPARLGQPRRRDHRRRGQSAQPHVLRRDPRRVAGAIAARFQRPWNGPRNDRGRRSPRCRDRPSSCSFAGPGGDEPPGLPGVVIIIAFLRGAVAAFRMAFRKARSASRNCYDARPMNL